LSARLASVFMGTPDFAVPVLGALARVSDLRLVVTQPDRPVGRGRRVEPPPVKVAAAELGVPLIQPPKVTGRRFAARIATREPDVLVTAAFGRILGRKLLVVPRLGCLNVHASLLPSYRGAAPINWAILNGEPRTGVSIVKMVEQLDAGPVYRTAETAIEPDESAGELSVRLSRLGADALVEVLEHLGDLEPAAQDEALVSWAPLLKKADGVIDWALAADRLGDHVRGMHPWPCASTLVDGQQLKVHRARVLRADGTQGTPGTVLRHSSEGLDVACGRGTLRLVDLQLPGKKRLDARQFHAGRQIPAGTGLGGR
jgi:methionyl-tRNA formyltransferase